MTQTTSHVPDPDENGEHSSSRLMTRATLAAVATGTSLVVIKFAAWLMTGSVSILGSLIDSLMDTFASVLNFVAVRTSLQPPDDEHRFGHGKAEALAGLGQFAFMGGSAVFLVLESIDNLVNPRLIEASGIGYAVIVISIFATLGLVSFQRYVVRHTNSLAVGADELHYRSDLLMNTGVIVAIALNSTGLFARADAIFGLVIAGILGYSAFQIMRRSYDELMDREFDDEERQKIMDIVMAHPEVLDMHDLRTRRSGLNAFIQFHLEMDGNMRLTEAHRLADAVEAEVVAAFENAEVIIHQDPAGLENPGQLARS